MSQQDAQVAGGAFQVGNSTISKTRGITGKAWWLLQVEVFQSILRYVKGVELWEMRVDPEGELRFFVVSLGDWRLFFVWKYLGGAEIQPVCWVTFLPRRGVLFSEIPQRAKWASGLLEDLLKCVLALRGKCSEQLQISTRDFLYLASHCIVFYSWWWRHPFWEGAPSGEAWSVWEVLVGQSSNAHRTSDSGRLVLWSLHFPWRPFSEPHKVCAYSPGSNTSHRCCYDDRSYGLEPVTEVIEVALKVWSSSHLC
jgi:hypothetical protein